MTENKAIVLENGFIIDIPEELIRYLEKNKIRWDWYDMREKFWPENQKATVGFFTDLPKGQLLICSTVFDGYQQLELMIQLLYKLREKSFTFKIMQGCLCNNLLDFLAEEESSITPKELEAEFEKNLTDEECDAIYEKIYDFKKEINRQFVEVLQSHNVYWIKSHGEDVLLKTVDDIEKNKYDL